VAVKSRVTRAVRYMDMTAPLAISMPRWYRLIAYGQNRSGTPPARNVPGPARSLLQAPCQGRSRGGLARFLHSGTYEHWHVACMVVPASLQAAPRLAWHAPCMVAAGSRHAFCI